MKNRIPNFDDFSISESVFDVKYPRGSVYLDDNKIQRKLRKGTQAVENIAKEMQFSKLYDKMGEEKFLAALGFEKDNAPVELIDKFLKIKTTSIFYNTHIMNQQYIAVTNGKFQWWHETAGHGNFGFLSEYDTMKELLYYFWRDFGFNKN